MQSRPPERFEDLPAHLQDKLLRAPARQADTRRVRVLSRRALGYAIAAAVLALLPGAWLVSLCAAPMAILNAGMAIREARGVPELTVQRGWAIAGLAVGAAVLLGIVYQVTRTVLAFEELWQQLP